MYSKEVIEHPPFQLHLEPDDPIELGEMLRCLAAIGHQFEIFAAEEGISSAKDAKLLVSSVRPGSIDIGLLPDLSTLGVLVAPVLVYSPPVLKFAAALKELIDKFRKKSPTDGVSIKDCGDVAAIIAPTATHGGSQTFNTYNGAVWAPVFQVTAADAREVLSNAVEAKKLLEGTEHERKQRVPMVWHGMDTDGARTSGSRNPDKGIIEEIDAKPRPIFFEDEFAHLKDAMIGDHANPYKLVFFVDVEVSRVGGKVVAYRIVGYHGSTETED